MYLLSRETLAIFIVAATAQGLIDAAASPAWGWPASCGVIAATLVAVRAIWDRKRRAVAVVVS